MELTQTSKRWWIAAALVAATALAGGAAKGRGIVTSTAGDSRRFTAPPAGRVSFAGTLDKTAVLVGGESLVRMELVIGAQADSRAASARVPSDLIVVLDRSGSMAGDKIEHARGAIRELVGQLGSHDRFGLVTYSNDATLAIPLSAVDDRARAAWLETVSGIVPDGGTNLAAGLDLGLDTIERSRSSGRVPRAILISDGLANQGDATPEGLLRRAGRAARGEYMLTTVGVGADFNEYLMSALADAGTGNYYYLRGAEDLARVFAREFDAARSTVASGLEVTIQPGEGVEVVDAAGYPLERGPQGVMFRPGSLFAGQERRVWVTMSVPNDKVGEHDLGSFTLAYSQGGNRSTLRFAQTPRVAAVAREDDFYARVDAPAWTRSMLVDGYNKMQEEVAREVKAGRRDGALQAVREFRKEAGAMNARIGSAPVQAKIESLGRLENEVVAAFEGDEQALRQNELSKTRSADALDQRRSGSKR
jgi:Ca-activated chloride channel family protein